MNVSVYAIFDTKAQCFWVPFILPNDATAIRQFIDLATSGETEISKHPLDFTLFRLGKISRADGETLGDMEELLSGLQAIHHAESEAQQLKMILGKGEDDNA